MMTSAAHAAATTCPRPLQDSKDNTDCLIHPGNTDCSNNINYMDVSSFGVHAFKQVPATQDRELFTSHATAQQGPTVAPCCLSHRSFN